MINILIGICALVFMFCFQVVMVRYFFRIDEIVNLLEDIKEEVKRDKN